MVTGGLKCVCISMSVCLCIDVCLSPVHVHGLVKVVVVLHTFIQEFRLQGTQRYTVHMLGDYKSDIALIGVL